MTMRVVACSLLFASQASAYCVFTVRLSRSQLAAGTVSATTRKLHQVCVEFLSVTAERFLAPLVPKLIRVHHEATVMS